MAKLNSTFSFLIVLLCDLALGATQYTGGKSGGSGSGNGLNKGSKIGILGAGVSGTFLSYFLSSNGFTDITVIEKESLPAHICDTTWVNDKPYDTSIVYAGVQLVANEPDLWKALEPMKATISPLLASLPKNLSLGTTRTGTLNFAEHVAAMDMHPYHVNPLPTKKWAGILPIFQGLATNPAEVILEFIQVWELTEYWIEAGLFGVQDCLDHNIATSTETFGEFILRKNVPIVGKHIAMMFDFFNNPVTINAPACQVIAGSLIKFQAVIPNYLGSALLLSPQSIALIPPLLMVQVLIASENDVTLDRFEEGYCELFYRTQKAAEKKYHAKFRFNEEVTSVTSHGFHQIEVITNKARKYEFDALIFTLRPQHLAALNIPSISSHFQNQFSLVYYPTQLIKASIPFDTSDPLDPNSKVILFPVDQTLGTSQVDFSGRLQGMDVQYPDDMADTWIIIGNSQSPTGFADIAADMKQYFNASIEKVYFDRVVYEGPNYLLQSDISSFYQWIETQQGSEQTGFYFVGQTFAGHGVPENFEFTLRFAEKYFYNLPGAAAAHSSHSFRTKSSSFSGRSARQQNLQPRP